MVECMGATKEKLVEYLHPPINRCTLNFLKSKYETEFRHHYIEVYCI